MAHRAKDYLFICQILCLGIVPRIRAVMGVSDLGYTMLAGSLSGYITQSELGLFTRLFPQTLLVVVYHNWYIEKSR